MSTSPTLHAVNRESLRQYSTESSAGSSKKKKNNYEDYKHVKRKENNQEISTSCFLLCVSVVVFDGICSVPSPVVASNMSSFMPPASVLHNSVKQVCKTSETGLLQDQ